MEKIREATGFDGGSTHLSAVRLLQKGDTYTVRNCGHITTLNPVDDINFHLTYREFRKKEKIKPRNLVVGLSGRSVMIRYLKIPIVPDWKLDMMMEFEIDEQTNTFSQDSFCAFRKVDIPGIRKYNVMMIGVTTRDLVEFYLENIPGIESFNMNSLALFAASLLSEQVNKDKVTLLVDIGAFNTDIAIVKGSFLLFGRNIQYGASYFDEDIVKLLNVDISQAERFKIEQGCVRSQLLKTETSSKHEAKLQESLTSSARIFYTHLTSAVEYCKEQIRFYDFSIDKVLTTGGGSLLKGLNEYLEEHLKVPVEHLNIESKLDLTGLGSEKADYFRELLPFSTTAIGLAVSALHKNAAVLNTMPQKVIRRRRFFKREFFLFPAAMLFIASLVMWGWFMISRNISIEDEISKRKDLLESAKELALQISREEYFYNKYFSMEYALKKRVYSSTDILKIFNILQQTIPEDVWITSFSTEDIGTISVSEGTAKEYDEESTIQNRGTVYISGQVRIRVEELSDPHQLLDDYTDRLKKGYSLFDRITPLKKEYSDSEKKDKFFFKYKILLSHR